MGGTKPRGNLIHQPRLDRQDSGLGTGERFQVLGDLASPFGKLSPSFGSQIHHANLGGGDQFGAFAFGEFTLKILF